MNGLIIPRDASQQIFESKLIDDKRNWKNQKWKFDVFWIEGKRRIDRSYVDW